MTREELAANFCSEMTDVRVSPQLKNMTLRRTQQREEPVMKKKMPLALVCVLLMMICAVAVAAVARLGILDFAGNHQNVYVPEDAQDYVQSDVLHMENELVTVDLRELYYDGIIVRVTVDVKPKSNKIMLVGEDMSMDDPWINMTPMEIEFEKTYTQTARDVYMEGGYESVYSVSASLVTGEGWAMGTGNYSLNEDGTFTIYNQWEFDGIKAQQEGTFKLTLFPYEDDLELINIEGRIDLEQPITLTVAEYDAQTYESTQPVDFPSAGVRVDKLTLEVRAQEIHALIDYSVTDEEVYNAHEGGLWFEFIDPNSTSTEPYNQRLMGGLSSGGRSGATGDDGLHYRQVETLGRNELHSAYTLRVYNSWDKERFETQIISVELVK